MVDEMGWDEDGGREEGCDEALRMSVDEPANAKALLR